MSKYIDADKLIATLERQNADRKIIQPLIRIIDSLQQEQDLIVINKKVWEAQEQFRKNKDFRKPLQQEQPHWVPSKEQMKAIESCFCEFGEGYPDEDGLRSLYNDLKKLM